MHWASKVSGPIRRRCELSNQSPVGVDTDGTLFSAVTRVRLRMAQGSDCGALRKSLGQRSSTTPVIALFCSLQILSPYFPLGARLLSDSSVF